MSADNSSFERRTRQRFPARRDGDPCVWLALGDQRWPLNDLSLDGFGVSADAPLIANQEFDFILRLQDSPDKIIGRAQAMNVVGDQIGCRILKLEGAGAERLHEWLTVIVIWSAKLRITAKEAEAIVKGPSLI